MDTKLPGIVVTGASGFIGRHFLASAAGRYRLFCLARRSREESQIPAYENLHWSQVDVARWDDLREVVHCVKSHGGASAVLHLAGYYDFHNMEHPEYERTNVKGTRNVLKLARQLGVGRFIFASSLAACRFPPAGLAITEDSPADAGFAYARSKRDAEELICAHTQWIPASIVRLAAVYSDWCEYPPLYVFLKTWLSDGWNACILGGRGESAVPYIHVQDLVKLFHVILERSATLPRLAVYNASPNSVASHRDLFQMATRAYYGTDIQPRCVPRVLAVPGVFLRWWLGKARGAAPFEAPWMMRYVDAQLRVDANRTHAALDWRPAPRMDVVRRLLVMIENMKTHSEIWHQRNEAALRRVAYRPNLVIARILDDLREELIARIAERVNSPDLASQFAGYHDMERETLRWYLALLYQVLVASVRTRDRQLIRHYAQVIATRRQQEGFSSDEVRDFLILVGKIVTETLRTHAELVGHEQPIHDNVGLAFQLAVDGIEDVYEAHEALNPELIARGQGFAELGSNRDLEHMVHQLRDLCGDVFPTPGVHANTATTDRPVIGP